MTTEHSQLLDNLKSFIKENRHVISKCRFQDEFSAIEGELQAVIDNANEAQEQRDREEYIRCNRICGEQLV